ncbi:universal stress protein [Nocardioides humi]|uniref:Universal stress protein n=1 Tax=Nocardioides humi TaxID=449461 RepID=A0ABN2BCT2_9ACTN|nr:universal stress protein [Nocardioides humi]
MTTTAHTIDPSSVVVAADGSDHADRAVQWAAGQAFRERRPLTVVTAIGIPGVPAVSWAGMGAAYAYQPDELLQRGRAIADEAAAVARHLHPGLDVSTVPLIGDPRQVLVEISQRVHLLVLGSRGRGAFRSKVLGSVSAAVSRDAACPVVVCRPQAGDGHPDRGVLVGADGTAESLPVVEFAFQQASLLDLPLTVVHCLWDEVAAVHGPVMVSPRETGLDEYRMLLSENVAGMSSKFPEVTVDLRLARGLAEECLSDTSGSWNLIVVGRHPVDSLLRLITGAVATAVVERAHTTVAVVPQAEPAAEGAESPESTES